MIFESRVFNIERNRRDRFIMDIIGFINTGNFIDFSINMLEQGDGFNLSVTKWYDDQNADLNLRVDGRVVRSGFDDLNSLDELEQIISARVLESLDNGRIRDEFLDHFKITYCSNLGSFLSLYVFVGLREGQFPQRMWRPELVTDPSQLLS